MTTCTEIIELHNVKYRVEFDYEPAEPATYDYPGNPESIEVTGLERYEGSDMTWLLDFPGVESAVLDAIYALKGKR